MYIMPDTEIRLIRNCPLIPTYEHTMWFDTSTEQYDYFSNLQTIKFDKVSYQRHTKNSIKLSILADKIYNCNYMMFKNKAFGNKWFYAFITNIEYVSNDVSTIHYQIDVMQTWLFDYEMKQCFVEREHVMNDTIGANLVPENLERGDYITTNEVNFENISTQSKVFIYVTELTDDLKNNEWLDRFNIKVSQPNTYFGSYIPCYVIEQKQLLPNHTWVKIISDLYADAGKDSAIVACFLAPSFLSLPEPQPSVNPYNAYKTTLNIATRLLPRPVNNNKLYTYPYCCAIIQCNEQVAELKYERFSNNTPKCQILSTLTPNTKLVVNPINYMGHDIDYTRTITLGGFPMLAWVSDYYQNWLTANQSRLNASYVSAGLKGGTQVLAGVATSITGFATGNPVLGVAGIMGALSGGANIFTGVQNVTAEKTANEIVPNELNGNLNSGEVLHANGDLIVRTYCKTITPEFISIIDKYFDKYGYAVNTIKLPNRNGRKSWNFVKTIGCNITGGVPADDTKIICSLYDNGITFWKKNKTIGDYNQDNKL